MLFNIITLFPEFFKSPLQTSLIKKALDNKLIQVNIFNLRDYTEYNHRQCDEKNKSWIHIAFSRAIDLTNSGKSPAYPWPDPYYSRFPEDTDKAIRDNGTRSWSVILAETTIIVSWSDQLIHLIWGARLTRMPGGKLTVPSLPQNNKLGDRQWKLKNQPDGLI